MENRQKIKELFHEALDIPLSERDGFLAANCRDEAVRREVENLLKFHDEAGDFIAAPAVFEAGAVEPIFDDETENRIGEKIGNYEIVREIGRGGMGAVYLAVRADDEFRQEVALKIVKRGMDTDFILKRFRNERQILAGLNHPNIARLLEGGTTDDGLPYFVMEYVDGQDLISYCFEKNLSLTERLNLFREICSAVSYAHQNLIVHRDLKPSNILVTPEGVPKLLDFGIAKLLNENNTDKTTGVMRLLTPEYSSPEQIRAEPMTTTSDVYSLGVILYELLTGQSPYGAKNKGFDNIVRAVCETEPKVPSESWRDAETRRHGDTEYNRQLLTNLSASPTHRVTASQLKGDLDNIVIKALQKESSRRYQSVQEFSEDIRRHLVGLPVTAQADTYRYRIAKFVKRHRAAVFAGVFMFLSLVVGISVATWQAVEARRERAKAEQRFNEVRKLANSFLFEFHDAIENLPGSTPARKMVIERALPYLDNLSQESQGDDSLQNELAESYRRLGMIQGHPLFPNIGDVKGGVESVRKAIKIGEELVKRNPTNADYRYNLATHYMTLGDMYNDATYDLPNALVNYQMALKIGEELRAENAEDPNTLAILNSAYERVGNIRFKMGDLKGAFNDYQASQTITERLLASRPDNLDLQRGIVISYMEIGRVLHADGKYREALEQFAKSRDLLNNSIAADPNNADLPRNLAICNDDAAKSHIELGEIEAATDFSNNSLASREKMFAADPTNIQIYGDLTVSLDTAGELRIKAGDAVGALKLLNRSLEMREAAFKQDPTMILAKHYIGVSRGKIAKAFRVQNNLNAAFEQQREALKIYRELQRDDATNLEIRRQMAELLQQTGETLTLIALKERSREKWNEARAMFEESISIYEGMKNNNQFFGSDGGKIESISAFIEKYQSPFNP